MGLIRDPLQQKCLTCGAEAGQPCDTSRYPNLMRAFHALRYPVTKHGGPPGCIAYRLCRDRGCLGYCKQV